MSRCGCENCKFFKCYRGDYWTPDEYECTSECEDITEPIFESVWTDGETWNSSDEPICPGYEDAPTEDDEYWEEYAYKERYSERS